MTSVAFEASALPPRPAKTERASRPTGMREAGEDRDFGAMVERENGAEPKPATKPAGQAASSASANRTESQDAVSPDAGAIRNETDQAGALEEVKADAFAADPSGIVTQPTVLPDQAPIVTAAVPALPVSEPVAGPVPAALVPVQPVTETPSEAANPAALEPVAAAAPAAPGVAAPATASTPKSTADATSAVPAQSGLKPQIKGSATADAGTPAAAAPETGEAQTASGQSETVDAPAPKQTQQAPAQTAPAGTHAKSDKPVTPDSTAAKPDDIAFTAKPTIDTAAQSAQLVAPAHAAHSGAPLSATAQAAPVSAAQPVPVNALAFEIAGQARAGNSRFEIRLDPPELGRIDVRLDVDRDGNVTSRLVIERADTYDLLRRDQSTLERALQQAGLKTSENALEFSLRDQGFAQRQDPDDSPRGTRAQLHDAEVAPSEAANGYARLLGARGGIDIRV